MIEHLGSPRASPSRAQARACARRARTCLGRPLIHYANAMACSPSPPARARSRYPQAGNTDGRAGVTSHF